MSATSLLLILLWLGSYIAGQLLLKHAMDETNGTQANSRSSAKRLLFGGIAAMAVSFFLNVGLLQHFELSYLYPFNGLSVIFITLFAAAVLKERLSFRLVAGAVLISAGVALVSVT